MEHSPTFCQLDGCTREILPGGRYCRFCQKKGSFRDYREQSLLHQQAIKSRLERETEAPEPWKILFEYCRPLESARYGITYTYAIGLHRYAKFGRAMNVEGRLMELQIANPRRLRVLGRIKSSMELEHHMHDALRKHVCRGEWFQLNDTTREFIRLMNSNDLVGICKKISVLIREDDGVVLLEKARNVMHFYEKIPSLA